MITQAVFIVIEKHMYSSLKKIEQELIHKGIDVKLFFFPNHSPFDFMWRLKNQRQYFAKLRTLANEQLKDIDDKCLIFFSCGEGFEVSNQDKWLPEKFKKSKKIAIQHGVFTTSDLKKGENKLSHSIRQLINNGTNLIFDFNILGRGFGGTKFDYYIVYAQKYKQHLLESRGWKAESVLISGLSLKDITIKPVPKNSKNQETALLLLQDIAFAKITTESKSFEYLDTIVAQLKNCYKTVKIRLHPKMERAKYDNYFKSYDNVTVTNTTLEDDLKEVDTAFSYVSTTLIDAFLMGVPVVGILIPEIDSHDYSFLKQGVNLDNIEFFIKSLKNYDNCTINEEYFDLKDYTKEVIAELTRA